MIEEEWRPRSCLPSISCSVTSCSLLHLMFSIQLMSGDGRKCELCLTLVEVDPSYTEAAVNSVMTSQALKEAEVDLQCLVCFSNLLALHLLESLFECLSCFASGTGSLVSLSSHMQFVSYMSNCFHFLSFVISSVCRQVGSIHLVSVLVYIAVSLKLLQVSSCIRTATLIFPSFTWKC